MIHLKTCPICASSRISDSNQVGLAPKVDHEIMPGTKIDAVILAKYFVCQNCRILFQNPRMSDRELSVFYSKGYYRKTLNLTEKEMDEDEKRRAQVDKELIFEIVGQPKSHLDIGCSRGYLLNEVGAEKKVGVESNRDYLKVKNVKVYSKMNKVPRQEFNLVTTIHTLEHVSEPLKYLEEMTDFLTNDGFLVVEVPTWKSPGGPLRLAHLYHFETDVLKNLCKEVRLKVVEVRFTPHLLVFCKKLY